MQALLLTALLTVQIGPMETEAAREPQMAVTQSMVGLTFGAGKAIYFSASHDAGKTFSKPVKVAEAEILPLSRHRGPRIALWGNTIVISAVTGRRLAEGPHAHGLPSDGDLWAWRSVDGGKTWSKGVRINDVAGADVVVEVNTGGSLAADFSIRLVKTTLASMNAGDFVL